MTDQSTRDQWTRPTRTLERANPDQTGPEPSTQDSTAPDPAAAERSAEDGPAYRSAAHDAATPERPVAEQDDLDHAEPEHVVGVASMPDAEPERNSQAAQDHRGVATVTDPGGLVDDVNEEGGVTSDATPTVPASGADTIAPDISGSGELLPGDVPAAPVTLFDGATSERFRDRWQQLQMRFVDDPHTVATQAGALADEVVIALRDAVDQQRTALEDWQSDHGADAHFGDTERLRVAVRRYRAFVDRLLAM